MKDHWTSEEYKEYLQTGRMPASAETNDPVQRGRIINNASMRCMEESREKIERQWAEAVQRGEIMTLEIPAEPETVKQRKYRNIPTWVDGIRFDSKHEAEVYQQLMLRVKSGELKCVMRQVRFDLGGGRNAQRDSRYKYVADFVTIDKESHVHVLDAKSEATRKNRTYIDKKKQMLAEWGIEIEEV